MEIPITYNKLPQSAMTSADCGSFYILYQMIWTSKAVYILSRLL